MSRLAQLVERKTLNLVVEGSSPSVGIFLFTFFCFPLPSWVGTSNMTLGDKPISASRLAQLVERKTLNLVVEGSSPSVGINFYIFSWTQGRLFF